MFCAASSAFRAPGLERHHKRVAAYSKHMPSWNLKHALRRVALHPRIAPRPGDGICIRSEKGDGNVRPLLRRRVSRRPRYSRSRSTGRLTIQPGRSLSIAFARTGAKRYSMSAAGRDSSRRSSRTVAFARYTGLDFSSVAVEMAQARTRRSRFRVGDVRKPDTYEGLDYDAVICMEVLEHIEEDLAVLSCFRAGTRCLLTVPNFPWRSHVRHFDSEASVSQRYGEFFDQFLVTRIKGVRTDQEQFYLIDGVRMRSCHRDGLRGARWHTTAGAERLRCRVR